MTHVQRQYIGWHVLIEEQTFTVVEIGVRDGSVSLTDKDGVYSHISFERFRELIHSEMAFDPNADARSLRRMLNASEQKELSFKKRVITAIRVHRGGGLTWQAAYNRLVLDFLDDKYTSFRANGFPSLRTVQSWDKLDRSKGDAGLRPKHTNKGNRAPRYDFLFEEVTYDLLEERFLTSDRMTVTSLARLAKAKYQKKCEELDLKPGPCGSKCVNAIIQLLPHADVVKLRLGSAEARKQYLLAMNLQKVEVPFARLEADSTTLDMWCVDDDGDPVGRPTVCAVIDCATGLILGLQVSWGAPSSSLTARTMKEVFVPKTDAFFDRYKIQNRFQAVGTPQLTVSDQGSENSGDIIGSVLSASAQDWLKCVPGQPDKKPFIERFFRELSRFITQFQGASQTSEIGAKKRTKIAEAEAVYTIREVEEMLQRWRYDIYAQKQRRRVQNILRTNESPIAAWNRLSRRHLLPPAPSAVQVREMFMVEEAVRVAERDGIMFKNIRYASCELKNYLERVGVRNKVQIRYDPNDIREIAVWDELAHEHFFVPTKRENCPALSFAQLDAARKALRTPDIEEIETQAILAELQIYEDFKDKADKLTSKKRRAKQIAATRNKELIERSDRQPGEDPTNSAKRKRIKPTVSLPGNMPKKSTRRHS